MDPEWREVQPGRWVAVAPGAPMTPPPAAADVRALDAAIARLTGTVERLAWIVLWLARLTVVNGLLAVLMWWFLR